MWVAERPTTLLILPALRHKPVIWTDHYLDHYLKQGQRLKRQSDDLAQGHLLGIFLTSALLESKIMTTSRNPLPLQLNQLNTQAMATSCNPLPFQLSQLSTEAMTTSQNSIQSSILLVDDDKVTRLIMKSLLIKHGYHVTDVDTGEECLEQYQLSKPDMILLDAEMPGIDGFTCCSKIKQMPGGDRTPILMITGLNDSKSVDRAFDAGAIDYVTKPIHPAVLTRRLQRILEGEQAKQTLEKQHQLLQEDLTEASEYVCNLLPDPISTPVKVNRLFQPSLDLGGDAFDYYWLDDTHLVMYLVDVAGHGAKSALLSVSILNLLRSQALVGADLYRPSTVLAKLNEVFEMSDRGGNYFTIWYGVYNRENQELIYSSGGHPPSVLISEGPTGFVVQSLDSDGIPIGMLLDEEFEDQVCLISKHDRLYIFSDGVYEIENDDGLLWGFDAFVDTLKLKQEKEEPPSNVLNIIFQSAKQFCGQDTLEDDFSILEIEF